MKFLVHSIWAILSAFALSASLAHAEAPILDNLAGAWNDLDGFATIGQCISSPNNSPFICSPAQLSRVEAGRFEGRGTISATDSVLKVSDTLRRNDVSATDVSEVFRDYNYTDVLVNVDLNYIGRNFMIGIRPVRYQGQFEVHNPSLPFVSLAVREDQDFHMGYGRSFGGDKFRWSVGTVGTLLFRDEILLEATLVDVAVRPPAELLDRQKLTGYFFDVGTSFEFQNFVNVAVLGKDMGNWFGNKRDHVNRYLFLHTDKAPKVIVSASVLPKLAGGRLQVGLSTIRFIDEDNSLDRQWFGTLSYYVGPLRLLTGFRPELFRSAVAIRFSRFEVNVAQEWINHIETGRRAQPRFTLEVTSGL